MAERSEDLSFEDMRSVCKFAGGGISLAGLGMGAMAYKTLGDERERLTAAGRESIDALARIEESPAPGRTLEAARDLREFATAIPYPDGSRQIKALAEGLEGAELQRTGPYVAIAESVLQSSLDRHVIEQYQAVGMGLLTTIGGATILGIALYKKIWK